MAAEKSFLKTRIEIKAQKNLSESTNSAFTTFYFWGKETIKTVVVFSNRRPEVLEEPNGAFLWQVFYVKAREQEEVTLQSVGFGFQT